ncbi:MAG: pantoate--beta-alanine ligase [Acidimicrobiaceae bacterium]|nr:pantoate--beta-alanine ligase [Acidimicrobiaceae bacterium]
MDRIYSAVEFQATCENLRIGGKTIGLVPTMGALHGGHQQLIVNARRECDVVVVSVFVNALQFDNPGDLEKYPRTIEKDIEFAQTHGVDLVFTPDPEEMHPQPVLFHLEVDRLANILEGASRPGHFSGVVTVVSKLFILAGKCRAYFGEKDFQQVAVISRMVEEMHFPVEIVPVPIVREGTGLALSSRNMRLDSEQLVAAAALSRSLYAARDAVRNGEMDPGKIEVLMQRELGREINGIAKSNQPVLDYAVVVDPRTLLKPERIEGPVRLLLAAWVGEVRLIDNIAAQADR